MQSMNSRADPAPSRWSYRFQRLMLTPLYRRVLRVGLPLAICLGLAAFWFGQPERRAALANTIADLRQQIENRPEFRVNLMAVDGASDDVSEAIRDLVALKFPMSSFDLDLGQLRATIATLPAVADVSLRIRNGGVLQVAVNERVPAVLWRNREGLNMLDAEGVVVGPLEARDARPDLPIIAGKGADKAVPEALSLIRAAGPLGPRLRGLVRMGERRWDLVLDRNQRILLPVERPVQALERVIAIGQAQDMLNRDLVAVDMRMAERPTLRMTQAATETWWDIKAQTTERLTQ